MKTSGSHTQISRFALVFIVVVISCAQVPRMAVAADGQTAVLQDVRQVGDLQRVQVSLKVEGTAQIDPVGEVKEVPKATIAATEWLAYQERVMALRPARDKEPRDAVSGRFYETAQAKRRIDDHEESAALRDNQKVILARSTGNSQFVSAGLPLSESELDMIMVPGNSLAAYHLLPNKEVSVGETWAHKPNQLVSLFNLDEVTVCDANSRLVAIENGLARMNLVANIMGHVDGAATEITVEGEYRFDLRWKRINWLSMVFKEDRESTAAAPGFVVNAELKMLAAPLKECPQLDPKTLEAVARIYKAGERTIRFDSGGGRYQFVYGPNWKVLDDRPQSTSLRLVERDKKVARCSVSRLKKRDPADPLKLETFQADIEKALGDRFATFSGAGESQRDDGYRVLRVGADGAVSGIPVQWIYYHFTSPDGECASYVYTMEKTAVAKFNGQDSQMVRSLRLFPPPADTTPKTNLAQSANGDDKAATDAAAKPAENRTGAAPRAIR